MTDLVSLRVLVVDDEPDVRLGLQKLAVSTGAEVRSSPSAEEALEVLAAWPAHLVLSDIMMGGMSGLDLLDEIKRRLPGARVVLITGFGTIELAVQAMHRGAAHLLTKPFDNEEILEALRRFGAEALADERIRASSSEVETGTERRILGSHPSMQAVMGLVDQVAPTPMSVLIQGESGSGKELVARAIHDRSRRCDRPFLAVNTAALPDALIESELFGHVRGAFTGALRERRGVFQRADGGTVLLDEIGLMSPGFQAKLLRVLQERTVTPLGTTQSVPVDFRLVAATSRDLSQAIADGRFRQDLFYRIGVVELRLPPLRERTSDVALLATHFLAKYLEGVSGTRGPAPSLSTEALRELERHSWPGNVRELENCIQRALVLSAGGEIRASHLGLHEDPLVAAEAQAAGMSYEEAKQRAVETFQRRFIDSALARAGGNITRTAQTCGLTRAALQRIMRALGLDRARYLPPADDLS